MFETEDQRNWTDASFKTYGTPLDRPFPVAVSPGEEVHQRVRLVITPDDGNGGASATLHNPRRRITSGHDGARGAREGSRPYAGVFLVAWTLLRQPPSFGRQVYAVGADPAVAGKAGIRVRMILFSVYCLCSVGAALGGFLSITQVGAVSASFTLERELAAVLGGTSLFGGRGGVEGTVFGAILIQTVANGLVVINANPYVYPLVTAVIIFLAVFADSLRERILRRLQIRQIRVETPATAAAR